MKKDIWKKKRNPLVYVGYAIAILLLGYVAYSVYYFISTGEQVEEFEVCGETQCVKTFHVHSDIHLELCGRTINLPLEKGSLQGPHTHKERNMIHYHERLPFDKTTGKLLDVTPLRVGAFMNEMDMVFNERCIAEYCNGQACPDGKPGMVRMFVNEQPNMEFDQYVWKDGDKITITFE